MPHLLEALHINKHFGDFHVLDDVSIEVPKGKIFGLLGPNGAGKTTLIRTLTRITAPDSGEIRYEGTPLNAELMSKVGYLPEERGLYRKMKVWEQALYLTRIKGVSKQKAEASLSDWFKRFNMEEWKGKAVQDLSKGMQQKLQFVITVAHDPDLLILDEPFSGFDPNNTEEIKQEILRLKEGGKTIVFSTHNMSSVEELCDNIALIHKGRNILHGKTDDVRSSFSQNLYEVVFRGSQVAFANGLGYQFEINTIQENAGTTRATVKSHTTEGSKVLLKSLTEFVEVVSFNEMIPSMHDIFVDLTSEQPVNQEAVEHE